MSLYTNPEPKSDPKALSVKNLLIWGGLLLVFAAFAFGPTILNTVQAWLEKPDEVSVETLEDGRVYFSNRTEGYEITFPAGWTTRYPENQDIVALEHSFDFEDVRQIQDLPPNIAVSSRELPAGISPDSMFAEMGESIRYNSLIVEKGEFQQNEDQVLWLIYDQIIYGEMTRTRVFVLLKEEQMVFIIAHALQRDFENYQDMFMACVSSFRWLAPDTSANVEN